GLLRLRRTSGGGLNGSVSPHGDSHYQARKSQKSAPEVLAEEIVTYVQTGLPARFQKASRLLAEAGSRVWTVQTDTDLTEIGHKIREALQEFSDVLYRDCCPGA